MAHDDVMQTLVVDAANGCWLSLHQETRYGWRWAVVHMDAVARLPALLDTRETRGSIAVEGGRFHVSDTEVCEDPTYRRDIEHGEGQHRAAAWIFRRAAAGSRPRGHGLSKLATRPRPDLLAVMHGSQERLGGREGLPTWGECARITGMNPSTGSPAGHAAHATHEPPPLEQVRGHPAVNFGAS